ncbi:hypothetical protein AMTRI_Chr10g227380 [Amborella trichopoda]
MGLNLREIIDNVFYPEILFYFPNNIEKKKIGSKETAILEIGRQNMNRRLNIDIPQNNTFLLPHDVLAATDHLIGMKFGMGTLDDMNHLKNKCILRLALVRLANVVRGSICGAIRHKFIPTPQNLLFGPGGLIVRNASFRIRDIHPSHYGRICPIDTSEGINVGCIGSLAIHARISDWRSIRSLFYEISERSKEEQPFYLSSRRDEYYMVMIATANSLALNQDIQDKQVIQARYHQEFVTIAWEHIDH